MGEQIEVDTMTQLRNMSRKEMLIQFAVLMGFVVLCMGGGGIMGAITANDFGDSSPWSVSVVLSVNIISYLSVVDIMLK